MFRFLELLTRYRVNGLCFIVSCLQVKQICQISRDSMCACWEESLHEIHLQHGRCNGHEHGVERRAERIGLPSE